MHVCHWLDAALIGRRSHPVDIRRISCGYPPEAFIIFRPPFHSLFKKSSSLADAISRIKNTRLPDIKTKTSFYKHFNSTTRLQHPPHCLQRLSKTLLNYQRKKGLREIKKGPMGKNWDTKGLFFNACIDHMFYCCWRRVTDCFL